MVDALTCVFGGLVGTSTSGAYIESATGIREGARTGLAAVTTGVLVPRPCLFFIPLLAPLQAFRYAYAPALIVVGLADGRLRWSTSTSRTSPSWRQAFATIPADGLHLQHRERTHRGPRSCRPAPQDGRPDKAERGWPPGGWVLAAICLIYFGFGLPH